VLARRRPIACWRTGCGRMKFCDECVLLNVPELPWLRGRPAHAGEPADA
jgi:hypothetical protein